MQRLLEAKVKEKLEAGVDDTAARNSSAARSVAACTAAVAAAQVQLQLQ